MILNFKYETSQVKIFMLSMKGFFMYYLLNKIMNYHITFYIIIFQLMISLYRNMYIHIYIINNWPHIEDSFMNISKIWKPLKACSYFKNILHCLHWALLDITYDGISQSQYLSLIFITYVVFFTVSNFECIILVKQTFLFNEALINRCFFIFLSLLDRIE